MNNGKKDIIIAEGVKKWFGDFQALKGVTTTVQDDPCNRPGKYIFMNSSSFSPKRKG